MNFSKKFHDIVRQNDKSMKTSQKHDANVQKNTTLYFQVGLILVLLAVHGLFEMNFAYTAINPPDYADKFDPDTFVDIPVIRVHVDEPVKTKPKKRRPVIFSNPVVENNDEDVPETSDIIAEPETSSDPAIDVSDVKDVFEVPESAPVPFIAVEHVPIYPGCESLESNLERRTCMEQKLKKLITRKFNGDMAENLGLTGKQRIYVQFKIDKQGYVTDIKTRAPHPKLGKEAERVINKIPKMKPGMQRDNAVEVIYQLPILFQVQY